MLIDTHCHLTKRLCKDPKGAIDRAKENEVEKLICIGTNLEDSIETIELSEKFPEVYATVGIHPEENCTDWGKFESLISHQKVVAIGECGIDNKVGLLNQKEVFLKQITLAEKYNKPLVIHSRAATEEVLGILDSRQNDDLSGVFHFYNFGKKKIKDVLDLGFYFGFDGNLTYEQGIQLVAKEIPLERIILETDSPFLSPIPFRSEQNEPKNVKIVAQCLADVKGLNFETVATATTQNAQKLFPNL